MHSLFFFAIVKLSLPEKFTTENIIKTRRKTSPLHYPHIHISTIVDGFIFSCYNKRGKIRNATDDGLGAYFYGVLCDYLLNDWLRVTLRN